MKEKDKAAQADDAKLKLDAEELNWYDHELRVMGRSIEELASVQQQRNGALEQMKGYQGMTMDELHAAATAIIAKYEDKTQVRKADKAQASPSVASRPRGCASLRSMRPRSSPARDAASMCRPARLAKPVRELAQLISAAPGG